MRYYKVAYEFAGVTRYWTTKAKDEKHTFMKFQNICMWASGYVYKVIDVTEIGEDWI